MLKPLLVLIVLWVMTMITLAILDGLDLLIIKGEGKLFGVISFEAAGASAFVIVFLVLLVWLLKKLPITETATRTLVQWLGQ